MTTSTHKEVHLGTLIGEEDFLGRFVTWGLWALALIVVLATVTGQVESFNGLYIWFATHGITGIWADFAPLMVDGFMVVGELAIFTGIARSWRWQGRILPWISALVGIGASVAGNIGDRIGHPISWELTAAIPPLAGAFGIVIGLGVLKRVAEDHARKKAEREEAEAKKEEEKPKLTAEQVAAIEAADRINLRRKLDTDNWSLPELEPVAGPSIETMERVQAANEERKADLEAKGIDALIPPKPPVTDTWPNGVAVGTQTVATAEPTGVSREQARRRLSDLKPGRPIIDPVGLDPEQSGIQPFTTDDVMNYEPATNEP